MPKTDFLEVNTIFMRDIINIVIEKIIKKYLKSKLNLSDIDVELDSLKASHNEEAARTELWTKVKVTISDKDLHDLVLNKLWKK